MIMLEIPTLFDPENHETLSKLLNILDRLHLLEMYDHKKLMVCYFVMINKGVWLEDYTNERFLSIVEKIQHYITLHLNLEQ